MFYIVGETFFETAFVKWKKQTTIKQIKCGKGKNKTLSFSCFDVLNHILDYYGTPCV